MTENRKIILDGSKINSARDFHEQIAKLLDFGPYYGHNIHALWDMIGAGMGDYCDLHWCNYEHSKEKLGDSDFNMIISIFNDVIEKDKKNGKISIGFKYFLE